MSDMAVTASGVVPVPDPDWDAPPGGDFTVRILGCGGSLGVPMVGGFWGRCDPANPKNRRRRPSILVEGPGGTILVDTGPDLRIQLLDAGTRRLDAILFTHAHADHVHGIDDVRPFLFETRKPIPAFADAPTRASLLERFAYAVDGVEMNRGFYHPLIRLAPMPVETVLAGIPIRSFVQAHGHGQSLGFRFGDWFAYSTDVSDLDEAAFEALAGIDVWVVDATRDRPHVSHAHVDKTLGWVDRVRPRRAYLTHMNHELDYEALTARLPAGVEPAYDGLVLRRTPTG